MRHSIPIIMLVGSLFAAILGCTPATNSGESPQIISQTEHSSQTPNPNVLTVDQSDTSLNQEKLVPLEKIEAFSDGESFSSQFPTSLSYQAFTEIQSGMTQTEVLKILGRPTAEEVQTIQYWNNGVAIVFNHRQEARSLASLGDASDTLADELLNLVIEDSKLEKFIERLGPHNSHQTDLRFLTWQLLDEGTIRLGVNSNNRVTSKEWNAFPRSSNS